MSLIAFDPIALLESPAWLLGNCTYVVMGLSVLMRNIVWLRVLAIAAGVGKIVYRTYFVYDPLSVFWETLFVAINVAQLLLIWWENRPPNFTAEEQHFVGIVAQGLRPAAARALLQRGVWHDVETGTKLTRAGERVNALLFLSSGKVRIESGGAIVATCGPGDFLGEMTLANGNAATATAIANEPVRLLSFERHALERLQTARPVLRLALQASFNRNLIDKLVRANGAPAGQAS
jgi:hypothetical protein